MNKFSPVTLPDAEKPTLLVILAHPDDETFGTGGTIAIYARRGVDVHLICATRGEAGEVDEKYLEGYHSIAERRIAELRCAAGKLGLKSVIFLDYRDSGMSGSPDNYHENALAAAEVDEVAKKILEQIHRLQPQVIITFDPSGGYRHPDHIAIHQAAVRAFEMAGDNKSMTLPRQSFTPPQKLYFHTMPKGWLRFMVWFSQLVGRDPRKAGRNGDIDLVSISETRYPTHARINYHPVVKIRDEASACHASQGEGRFRSGIFAPLQRLIASHDNYMRAFPPPQPDERLEHDLFEDVR